MPYIPGDRAHITPVCDAEPVKSGELTYALCTLVDNYVGVHGASYEILSDVVKALECSKLEFARRFLFPYEDRKRAENGEVFHRTREAMREIDGELIPRAPGTYYDELTKCWVTPSTPR